MPVIICGLRDQRQITIFTSPRLCARRQPYVLARSLWKIGEGDYRLHSQVEVQFFENHFHPPTSDEPVQGAHT